MYVFLFALFSPKICFTDWLYLIMKEHKFNFEFWLFFEKLLLALDAAKESILLYEEMTLEKVIVTAGAFETEGVRVPVQVFVGEFHLIDWNPLLACLTVLKKKIKIKYRVND